MSCTPLHKEAAMLVWAKQLSPRVKGKAIVKDGSCDLVKNLHYGITTLVVDNTPAQPTTVFK